MVYCPACISSCVYVPPSAIILLLLHALFLYKEESFKSYIDYSCKILNEVIADLTDRNIHTVKLQGYCSGI
jgi:hypothetical protein